MGGWEEKGGGKGGERAAERVVLVRVLYTQYKQIPLDYIPVRINVKVRTYSCRYIVVLVFFCTFAL